MPELTPQKRIQNLIAANEQKANEIKRLNRSNTAYSKEVDKLQQKLKVIQGLATADRQTINFSAPKVRRKYAATPVIVSSDLQLGEVLRPETIHGVNAYDVAIAALRFQYHHESVIKMLKCHPGNYKFDDGVVVAFLGDSISNSIHEELMEHNDGTTIQQALRALELHAAAIRLYAEEFGKVLTVWVPSNHGRTHKKTPYIEEARSSFDWFIAKTLEREFKEDSRVGFMISDSMDALVKVYDSTILVEHGHHLDGINSSAPAGPIPGVMRSTQKRRDRNQFFDMPFDHAIYGHGHFFATSPGLTLNDSYIGVNSMAWAHAFRSQHPTQALLLALPERGITHLPPIQVEAPGERELWPTAGRNPW